MKDSSWRERARKNTHRTWCQRGQWAVRKRAEDKEEGKEMALAESERVSWALEGNVT